MLQARIEPVNIGGGQKVHLLTTAIELSRIILTIPNIAIWWDMVVGSLTFGNCISGTTEWFEHQ
jgi:hypothetical protein